MKTPQVKGLAFRSVLACLAELRGAEAVDRALALLPPRAAEDVRFRVVATGWYPIDLYRQLWEAIAQSTKEGEALARVIGRDSLRRDLNLVHRTLLRLLSPTTVLAISSKLFGSYYDTGSLHNERQNSVLRVSWSGCTGFSRLMWVELQGSTEAMLEMCGGEHIRVRPVEGGREGDDFLVISAHWVV